MRDETAAVLRAIEAGRRPTADEARALAAESDLAPLLEPAGRLRDRRHPGTISYSRKVFIPLTKLCRDVCHYCTFAQPPKRGERAYLTRDEVLDIARAGAAAGCKEALFTLGDKPELRYAAAAEELSALGHSSTISYLVEMAGAVFHETGLLPHANPGVMTREEIAALRGVSVSQGIMLETISPRLSERGMPHHGSPDKEPARRLETIRIAGELAVPFTSGILIGIGETRLERVASLLALRDLHDEYAHVQELIVQNFRAKPDTRMALAPEPTLEDLLWTIAVTRLIFGPEMNIQAPPNLSPGVFERLIDAGLNDWGGVSPVTPDHVNPEAPWPHLDELRRRTEGRGKVLVERLAIYPAYAQAPQRWLDGRLAPAVLRAIDAEGLARTDPWSPGSHEVSLPDEYLPLDGRWSLTGHTASREVRDICARAQAGEALDEDEIVRLFAARGDDYAVVCEAADELRREVNGDIVTYVVNRNINYTNVCYFRCQFCAFSKGKLSEDLRGVPYNLDLAEIVRRSHEAWARGGTEVCMQGGIHPEYTGETYLSILRAVKDELPAIHVHAFSPLEVWQGAATLGLDLHTYLARLRDAGLGSLPGTAAEILDDEVRATLCPDKVSTAQWLQVMESAHAVGLRSTATIMYGHIERPLSWARHLLRLRELQQRTGGFTEFVPLPFVHMEAPIYLKGRARRGPTFREAVLMHAVARLALHPHFKNIQASWVKMGPDGVRACLQAGVNDLGGTLMNESITRAAGASFGQELPPERMDDLIRSIGRVSKQRTTTYGEPPPEQVAASYGAPPLTPVVQEPAPKWAHGSGDTPLVRPGLTPLGVPVVSD
jgi:FO synthase